MRMSHSFGAGYFARILHLESIDDYLFVTWLALLTKVCFYCAFDQFTEMMIMLHEVLEAVLIQESLNPLELPIKDLKA